MLVRLRPMALLGAVLAVAAPRQAAAAEAPEESRLGDALSIGTPLPAAAHAEREVLYRLGPFAVLGDGPSYAELGLGVFDAFEGRDDDGERSGAAQLQLRWGRKLFFLGPAIGLMGNLDGGVFGYAGVYADVAYGNVIVTPVLAAGGYAEDDSKDLGGIFQFRTELGIAYEFQERTRIGLRIAHISNAGIHDDNPGEEELFITFALPF